MTAYFYYISGQLYNYLNSKIYRVVDHGPDDLFFVIINGSIFISFLTIFLHFFTSLNVTLNSIIFILIITLGLINYKKNFKKKIIIKLSCLSLASLLFIIFSNINRPDAALYHLPYISYLNEHKIIPGISNIHFRFGHTSILQYLSAINFNFLFGINGISLPTSILALAIIFYFLNRILKICNEKQSNLEFFYILFILVFIFFKMIRYSEYGNDNITHLLYFLLISLCLSPYYNKNIFLITSLAIYIFLNKNTHILVLTIPLFFFLKNKFFNQKKIFFQNIISFHSLMLSFWIIKNVFISGCLIYPINTTCFEKYDWTENIEKIKNIQISSEAWSKGLPENTKEISEEQFIKKFNWLKAWSKKHLKYILNIIIPYILTLFLIIYLISRKNKKKISLSAEFYSLLLINTIFTLIFFLEFPLFRYGSSYLISLIVLLIIFFARKLTSDEKISLSKKFIFIFIIIFTIKQLERIKSRFNEIYINKPWPNIFSLSDVSMVEKIKIFEEKKLKIFIAENVCAYTMPICTNYKPEKLVIEKKFDYYIIKAK